MSSPDTSPRVAWLFPGQGAQELGMGRHLVKRFPPAEAILDQAGEQAGVPLKARCWRGPEEELTRTDVLQPAMTAVNLGCLAYLREHGYEPTCVAGHSLGEFSALHAASVLSLEDTLWLVCERGRLMHRAAEEAQGGMVALIGLGYEDATAIVEELRSAYRVGIANYNAPEQIVLSGEEAAMEAAAEQATERDVRAVRLNVSGAWHSPLMEDVRKALTAALDEVDFQPPQLTFVSSVSGQEEEDPDRIKALIGRQPTETVQWAPAVESLKSNGVTRFIEVGPGRVLRGLLRKIWLASEEYEVFGVQKPRDLERIQQADEQDTSKEKEYV